jgi:hypothetical protein
MRSPSSHKTARPVAPPAPSDRDKFIWRTPRSRQLPIVGLQRLVAPLACLADQRRPHRGRLHANVAAQKRVAAAHNQHEQALKAAQPSSVEEVTAIDSSGQGSASGVARPGPNEVVPGTFATDRAPWGRTRFLRPDRGRTTWPRCSTTSDYSIHCRQCRRCQPVRAVCIRLESRTSLPERGKAPPCAEVPAAYFAIS